MKQVLSTSALIFFLALTGADFAQTATVLDFNDIINQGDLNASVQALDQMKAQLPADDAAAAQLDVALYALQKRDFDTARESLSAFVGAGEYANTPVATQAAFAYATAAAEAGRPNDARSAIAALRDHADPRVVAWAYGAFKGAHLDVDATAQELSAWRQALSEIPAQDQTVARTQQTQRHIAELDEMISGSPVVSARKNYFRELLDYQAAVADKNWEAVPQELAEAKDAAQQYLNALPAAEDAEENNANNKRLEALYQLASLNFYQANYAAAKSLFQQTVALKDSANAENSSVLASAEYCIILCDKALGKPDAETEQALLAFLISQTHNEPTVASTLSLLGQLAENRGDAATAYTYYSDAVNGIRTRSLTRLASEKLAELEERSPELIVLGGPDIHSPAWQALAAAGKISTSEKGKPYIAARASKMRKLHIMIKTAAAVEAAQEQTQ